jgi:hypothetical protein
MDMKARTKILCLLPLLFGMSMKVCGAAPTPDKVSATCNEQLNKGNTGLFR